MSSTTNSKWALLKKQDVLLMILCAVLAAGFLALAASNMSAGVSNFLTIDSLFLTVVALTMALIFISIPAMYLRERGVLKNPFVLGEGIPEARAREEAVHFEGGTRLFLAVLGGLLALTLIEVLLAYIEVKVVIMMTILIGLSLIKAAMIIAYFMHLRFERMSLVLTLIPILVVCICLLFVFFPDGMRSHDLRSVKVSEAVKEGE